MKRLLAATLAALLLPACGGGGGGGGAPPPSTPTPTVLASAAADGTYGDADSDQADLSADGRYVVFRSLATNLLGAGADTNGFADIYRKDLQTGAVLRVSISDQVGQQPNAASSRPSISSTGRYIAFVSAATNIVSGITYAPTTTHVFLFDAQLGASTLLTPSTSAGNAGNASSDNPSISGDAAFVAFDSAATDLIAAFSGTTRNVFRRTVAGGTVLVSRSTTGATTAGDGNSVLPDVSDNGQFVAFSSAATDLITAGTDTNSVEDIFVRDVSGATTARVNLTPVTGLQATGGPSTKAAISGDGLVVAFKTNATNFGDPDASNDVWLRRNWSGGGAVTELVSTHHSLSGAGNTGMSCDDPAVDDTGRFVVFHSAEDFVTFDLNALRDVYRRDTTGLATVRASQGTNDEQGDGHSGFIGQRPALSSTGAYVAFDSAATVFTSPASAAGRRNVFRRGPF